MSAILWHSNAPWTPTGYGRCGRWLAAGLAQNGHRVGYIANSGFYNGRMRLDGFDLYGGSPGGFSEVDTIDLMDREKYDFLCTQYDVFTFNALVNELVKNRPWWNRRAWIPYVPLDAHTIFPDILQKLQYASYVVAMCEHGKRLLDRAAKLGGSFGVLGKSRAIYHGVDTATYKPAVELAADFITESTAPVNSLPALRDHLTPTLAKSLLRETVGMADVDFLVSMVGYNRGQRKQIPEQMEAVQVFARANPDTRIGFYLHTDTQSGDGYNIGGIAQMLGLNEIPNLVMKTPPSLVYRNGYDDLEMARLLAASDVVLHVSASEGFGMVIAEAQAAGTPVIAANNTAMTELLEPTPELLVGGLEANEDGSTYPTEPSFWVPNSPRSYWLANRAGVVEKLQLVLDADEERRRRWSQDLRAWAVKKYDWKEVIIPQWLDLFKDLEVQVEEECRRRPPPAEELVKASKVLEEELA